MATTGFYTPPFKQPSRNFLAHDASIESMEEENKQGCHHTFIDHDDQGCPVSYESEDGRSSISSDDDHEELDGGELQKILRGFHEKIDEQEQVLNKKLRFKLRKNGTIDRKVQETLHDFKGSAVVSNLFEKSSRSDSEASNDNMNTERGIDIGDILSSNQGGILEEPKLERFKVKAVNIVGVGVVKEENY